MGRDRMELHDILVSILGNENCYYSPPDGFQLSYPCIIYKQDILGSSFADNRRYIKRNRYSITLIDEDPDSKIIESLMELPTAYFESFFTNSNLNHWQLTLYF